MKKFLLALMIFPIFFIPGCNKSCQDEGALAKGLLRIGTNANFPPYETINEKGELIGFDIDLGKTLAKKMGLKAVFKQFDFDALVLALKKGHIDIILSGMSITPSRQKEIAMIPYLGEPIKEVSFLFWQSVPLVLKDFDSLRHYTKSNGMLVSVQAGHFLQEFLKEQGIPLKPLSGPPEQILDIKYKKSLAAALDPANAEELVSKHRDLKLVTLKLPKDKWDLGFGIGVNKSRKELAGKIENALHEIKDEGTLNALKIKWLRVVGN